MTATAQTNPVTELLEELDKQAQAVTLQTYQDFLHTVAMLVVDGTVDGIQCDAIIKSLANNGKEVGNKRLITAALTAAIKQIKRDMQTPPEGVKGGRGIYSLKDNGVWYSKPTKDGYAEPVQISPHLKVIAETYDTADGNNGRYIEFKDTRGRLKTWAMPAVFAAGDGVEITKYLRASGLNFVYGNDKEVIDYLLSSPVTDLCQHRLKTDPLWSKSPF